MSTSIKDRLSKINQLSRRQFALWFGVIGWGIPTGVLFALGESRRFGWDELWINLALSLVIFPLAGILFGNFLWWFMKRNASTHV